ncbi:MAG: hypothetical protein H6861_04535 [Rhodospirillales bacterium]|nr:hypothetical protein [Rhodospirillales bacterium]
MVRKRSNTSISFEAALERHAPVMLYLPGALSLFFGKTAKKGFEVSKVPETRKWIQERESFRATRDKGYGPSIYCALKPKNLLAFENAAKRVLVFRSPLFISFEDHYIPFSAFKMRDKTPEDVEAALICNKPETVLFENEKYRIGMPRLRKDEHGKALPFLPYVVLEEDARAVTWLPITAILSEAQVAPLADLTDRFEPQSAA